MKKAIILLVASVSASNVIVAHAGEIGHTNTAVLDTLNVSGPAISGPLYNDFYVSDRLNAPSGPASAMMNANIDLFALVPISVWTSPYKLLGATFGSDLTPAFANNSLEAALSVATAIGGSIRNSSFGLGDLYAQRTWLDWSGQHWDLSLAHAFYAPVSKFNSRNVALPDAAPATIESRDSIGLGYGSQQVQAGFAWYPMTNRTMAVTAIGTYEYESEDDSDLKPGQMITLNWGVSQYLPVTENHQLLLEVGPAGYDFYQITDSTGSNTLLANAKSCIHAAGGQIGLTYRPWNAFLTLHSFYEYAARSRFQGVSIGLNFGIKF